MAMIFSGPVMTTVLVTYAPTNTATQAIKDTYYAQLSLAEKTHAPPSNMLIILADMNAKVGQDVEAWPGIIGGFGGLSTTRPPSPPPLPSPPSPPVWSRESSTSRVPLMRRVFRAGGLK